MTVTTEAATITIAVIALITVAWRVVKIVNRWPYTCVVVVCSAYVITGPIIFVYATNHITDDKEMAFAIGCSVFLFGIFAFLAGCAAFSQCLDGKR